MKTFTKQLGDWELVAVPGRGGALAACRYRDQSILREAMGIAEDGGPVTDAAAYPMVPFCGRVLDARLVFEGEVYDLERNFPPEPHAIHGTGWQSSWSIDVADDHLSMVLVDDTLRWPWPFMAEQRFCTSGKSLQVEMTLVNIGERRMPAGLGWHPFFHADAIYLKADLETAPTGVVVPEPGLFWTSEYACQAIRKGIPTDGLRVDSAFLWTSRTVELIHERAGSLTLSGGETATALTLYRPPGAEFVAIEPLTHVPGAHAHPFPETLGLRTLAPGERLVLTTLLSVS